MYPAPVDTKATEQEEEKMAFNKTTEPHLLSSDIRVEDKKSEEKKGKNSQGERRNGKGLRGKRLKGTESFGAPD